MSYHRNTKFLAKSYFDLAVSRLEQINSETAPLYLLTAMGLAVKVTFPSCSSMKIARDPSAFRLQQWLK